MNIVEQSLLFLPLALAIYVSYAVLRIPDLTTDGSFVLGAAVFALGVHAGMHPFIAMLAATASGALAGIAVGLLQTRFQLNPLLAGILLVFILNTVTLKLMGRPNLSLFHLPSIFSGGPKIALLAPLGGCLVLGLGLLLSSRFGLMLYAFGNNSTLLDLCGKNAKAYRIAGLSISNSLVGFSGALTSQANGYVDIGMGTGIILIALGTVIMGQRFYRGSAKFLQLGFCFMGVVIYFSTVNLLISLGLDPIYLRMMMGLFLIGFLAMARKKQEAAA